MSARELVLHDFVPSYRIELPDGRYTYNQNASRMGEVEHAKMRAKIEGAYLGPWCPTCGKKGAPCSASKREQCRLRAILSGKRPKAGATLPEAPIPWLVSRRYVTGDAAARANRGWYHLSGFLRYDRLAAAQQYAYEVAMGRDAVESEAVVGLARVAA